ncbi:universal stress protein [Alkalinema sp. FACHB-956]|uniref:universal stress protein n=1 Tax=Alkalinema sp. FACHB-956 TaxID=2692768 RepID=UPI0016862CC5|nr:universal stress protein [Alkalinema sp. FACHB-956]MBD2327896.1 universal stress protein [Alkalinema sp. FACHB-956]
MFEKILVAIDRSPSHHSVFEAALTLAKALSGKLILLAVPSSDDPACPHLPTLNTNLYPLGFDRTVTEVYEELWEIYTKKGEEFLTQLVEEAKHAGIEAEFLQIPGNAGRTICATAQELQVDLIVLGRRGYSGLNELFLGSTSNYVLHHAPCSVLTIQHCFTPIPPDAPATQAKTKSSPATTIATPST